MISKPAIEKLKDNFPDAVIEVTGFRGEDTVRVSTGRIQDICMFLRDDPELHFDMAIDVIGADRLITGDKPSMIGYVNDPYDRKIRSVEETISAEERFEVIYVLYSTNHKEYLRLKVRVAESGGKVPSVVKVWKSANWAEREVYDMYGIIFDGHPDLRRVYMPDDFEYYPLRKDFPLMGVPGSLPLPDKQ